MIWLIALGLLLLAFLGAPFFALIAAIALLGFNAQGYDLAIVAVEINRLGEMPVLVAIPLFTLAGYLLSESEAPKRLVRLTQALVGWLPGGLAIVALVASALFTALTGASGVTIVALGAVLFPALIQGRYSERFGLGLVTASGSLGLLFAPSLPLIIYGVVAQQLNTTPQVSVEDLFLAGIIPGLLMLLVLSVYAITQSPHIPPEQRRFDWRAARAAILDARWELPLPVLVLGGIYSGRIAPSEAAALTAVYVFLVTVVIRREIALKRLPQIVREAMMLVGGILLILGTAFALTNYLIDAEIPTQLFAWVQAHVHQKWLFLLALNLFLLFFGMLLEGYPAIVVLTPLVLPIATGYGMDPVHFGILFLANLQIGLFLAPLGMNLFIASYRFKRPVTEVIRASWPFFLLLFACALAITYIPWLSLVLLDR
ncbi:MAG: TRAP transporter large permease subunit [Rhodanobacteraceae bacterium]|nr:TRAP transporter large permease subunit [Rhodanobacteraceae bacterium]